MTLVSNVRKDEVDRKQPVLTPNAMTVLEKRYLLQNDRGEIIETPAQLFTRVSKAIAANESRYGLDPTVIEKKFYDMMVSFDFLPNSPTLMNAGTKINQLSACFVLPVEDDMTSIFQAIKNAAVIHKSGGGTGFAFSRLRPTNDKVQTTGGVASGPISFMTVFNSATEIIKQGGRRRGANMGVLRVDHPDVLDFIECKQDLQTLNNFNISVGLTETFMEAVLSDTDYSLINPRNNESVGRQNARAVFEKIVHMAYTTGEPGILFLDRINAANPTPQIGKMEATNPCGEQPLLPYESCNLGSINVGNMVKNDSDWKFGYSIDYAKLELVTRLSVRFLDNVIDLSTFPLPEIEEMTKNNRKIGLGIMGFADLLIKLGIPYDSIEGINLAKKVMNFIHDTALQASQGLAQERGSFPNFSESTLAKNYPMMRNATLTTLAPTGTISIIAGCSSGIEPLFMLTYERRVLDDDILVEGYPFFVETAKRLDFYSQPMMEQVASKGSITEIETIPDEVKKIFVTAHDISPGAHVRMQAAFQGAGVDNAVSKTINFPNEASRDDIQQAYLLAYELGCKGITVYRSGSRTYDVLSKKGTNEQKTVTISQTKTKKPRQRPSVTQGITERVRVGCGTNLFITINEDEEGLTELFLSLGKSGGCVASHIEAMGRLISLTLRSRIDAEEIILQLKAIRCPSPTFGPDGPVLSCADAVAKSVERFLEQYSQNGNGKKEPKSDTQSNEDRYEPETLYLSHTTSGLRPECPECGNIVEHSEGCILCRVCGYSKCG
ncbi:MAG: vitamin B12-dependent ribonucleotide reductase [Candidatus Hodarchaeales archaeon]|jgi:ribonucleoside-diphosphate reductase alpha chain